MAIITTADVAPWVQSTAEELDADPLAQKIIDRASQLINETVFGIASTADYWLTPEVAPETARSIAEQLFARVYQNPKTLAAETTGPMTDRYADAVLTGMELRPGEVQRLLELRTDGSGTGGLWVLQTTPWPASAVPQDTVEYVDAYGEMTEPGVTYLASDYDHA